MGDDYRNLLAMIPVGNVDGAPVDQVIASLTQLRDEIQAEHPGCRIHVSLEEGPRGGCTMELYVYTEQPNVREK